MNFNSIQEHIINQLGQVIIASTEENTPPCIEIKADDLHKVCQLLYADDQLYFDSLSCITGLDNGSEVGTMEVLYNFYSIPYDHHLMVKVSLKRDAPSVASLTSIWKSADWMERETYDMYGIAFEGHSDLRRILLPADWEGFPLRKDYEEQDVYRGVKVAYGDKDSPKDIPN